MNATRTVRAAAAVVASAAACALLAPGLATPRAAGAEPGRAIWEQATRALFGDRRNGDGMTLQLTAEKSNPGAPWGTALTIRLDGSRAFTWKEALVRGGAMRFTVDAAGTRFERTGVETKPTTPEAHERFRKRWAMYSIVYLLTLPAGCGAEYSALGTKVMNGRDVIGVAVNGPCSRNYRVWFDQRTYRIAAVESEVTVVSSGGGPEKLLTETLLLDDFRPAGSIFVPFRASSSDVDSWQVIQVTAATAQ